MIYARPSVALLKYLYFVTVNSEIFFSYLYESIESRYHKRLPCLITLYVNI